MIKMAPVKKPVTDFLKSYPNKKTRSNYQTAVIHYLRFAAKPGKKNRRGCSLDRMARNYFRDAASGKHDVFSDCKLFSREISRNHSPTTTHLYLRCVLFWLEDNGCKLKRSEKKRIYAQLPLPYPAEISIELTRKTFREIYRYLPDDLQVLLLVLLSSGMRIGEALLLKKSDINWDAERTEIHIPAEITKTKTARTTYLTDEASLALRFYLQGVSGEYLFQTTYNRAHHHLFRVSEQLGLTRIINGRKRGIHWHMTRKWFISRVTLAAGKDIAEHLAGHEGYLSRSYRRYTQKQILKRYKRAEKKLRILTK